MFPSGSIRANAYLVQTFQEPINTIKRHGHLTHAVFAVIDGRTVMLGQKEHADHFRAVVGQHLLDHGEVTQGLGHLLIVNVHKSVVYPVFDKGHTKRPLALGNLVFMVGKN